MPDGGGAIDAGFVANTLDRGRPDRGDLSPGPVVGGDEGDRRRVGSTAGTRCGQTRPLSIQLQGELEKFEFLPHILAQNKEVVQLLQRGESVVGGEPINRYLERFNEISGASDTYVMDRSGLTLAASNWNTALPFVGKRFAFRPYFQEAMKGHAGRYYALGTTSQRRGFYFSFPVQQDQAILGVVVLKVSAERLERLLSHDTDTVIVTDAKGVIFLSTKPDWVFRTVKPLDPAEREQLRASRQYSDAELLPLPVSGEDYQPGGWRLLTLREPGGAGRIRRRAPVIWSRPRRCLTPTGSSTCSPIPTRWSGMP